MAQELGRVYIREELVRITGDWLQAAILDGLDQWGEGAFVDLKQLQASLLGIMDQRSLRRKLAPLVEVGFVLEGNIVSDSFDNRRLYGLNRAFLNYRLGMSQHTSNQRDNNRHDGHIYVCGNSALGLYKVGVTKDFPSNRIAQISKSQPTPIDIAHSWKSSNIYQAEKYIHDFLTPHRVNGEWFKLNNNDTQVIPLIELLVEYAIKRRG